MQRHDQSNDVKDIRKILNDEFSKRKERNTSYSLRAFARDIEVSPAILSMILRGQRPATREFIESIFKNFGLSSESIDDYYYTEQVLNSLKKCDFSPAQLEDFNIFSDWIPAALHSLAKLPSFKADPQWIANTLGISQQEAILGLELLVEHKIFELHNNQVKILKDYVIPNPSRDKEYKFSEALQWWLSYAKKSAESVERDEISKRKHTTITFPIDDKNLPEIKSKITIFLQNLMKEFKDKDSSQYNQVYGIEFALFPFTRFDGEKK